MNQDIQELLMALFGAFMLVVGFTANICLWIREWKLNHLIKKERRICAGRLRMIADNLKKLELLEKELERKKNIKVVFIYPFSEN